MLSLARIEGQQLLSAHEALLKGALESEVEVGLIVGPQRPPFRELLEIAGTEAVRPLLRQHGMHALAVPHAGRGVALAAAAVRNGRGAIALVPNDQLDHAMALLEEAARAELTRGAGLCLVLEDNPPAVPVTCPRQVAGRLGLVCLEAGTPGELREAVGQSMRLSRAGGRAAVLIVHHVVLRSSETMSVRPNRVLEGVDALLVGRGRRARRSESGGVLRTARRLELNRFSCLPSPGERVPVGFVAIGPAEGSLDHLVHALRLVGRVPVLHLRLLEPVDPAAVQRIATRCERLIVLEPRPGSIEGELLAVAEALRRQKERVASMWGRVLPPDSEGVEHALGDDEVVHPSILARKIVHLLHMIRPARQVAAQLVPEPPPLELVLPPRGTGLGAAGALETVRHMLEEVNAWLADGAPLEDRSLPPSAIVLDAIHPADGPGPAPRVIVAEVWEAARFQEEGISALRQAARDSRPWIFVICDVSSEDAQDLERLARGVAPEERAERVRIVLGAFSDPTALRELMREAALEERLTVIIVRDGPPPRFDIAAMERSIVEIDRLGFEPLQRLVRAADRACAFRLEGEEAAEEPRVAREPGRLITAASVDKLPSRVSGRVRIGVRPLLESIEVVRTVPPAQTWRRGMGKGLPLPVPIHANQARWRAHLAGCRGPAGPAAAALCLAGRRMGYSAQLVQDTTPIGPGRRAWAQVLFTNPRPEESARPPSALIPFGEADLLLGLDPAEALRAVAADPALRVAYADRTCAVVNRGAFTDDASARLSRQVDEALLPVLSEVVRDGQLFLEDISGACQAWFRTDRVADLVLLGIAFQRGLIPVTLDALEAGVEAAEARGFARSLEAFQFGRRLALDERLLSRPRAEARDEVKALPRRTALLLGRRRRGADRAEHFAHLVQRSLEAMPGLTETEAGRRARLDFVVALQRCLVWDGIEYAERYAGLITALYRHDRGDRGRALTRAAILPLAEAMLIREPLYVLAMATGDEQRRRARMQFNIKPARGDRITRRYLLRLELIAARRRFRIDVRIGEPVARAAAALRHIIPDRWRGLQRERELRQRVQDMIERAANEAETSYEQWQRTLEKLHGMAVGERME